MSVLIGYHASHEQFPPSRLLRLVKEAEGAGFAAAMCSDHIQPWIEQQGHSGFAWSWLGSALEATSLGFGVVNAPGDRYHPAVIAQAAATLEEMYPGRFWIAVGSGEFLNEHITGRGWPPKAERDRRLAECVEVMRRLWAGETVTFHGTVDVEEARLYSLPRRPPPVIGAAITPATARWLAGWADGLITSSQPLEKLRALLAAWREGGGERKPVYLQVKLSWARSDEEALECAWEQWRANCLESSVLSDLRLPRQFEAVGRVVRADALKECLTIGADLALHRRALRDYLDLGVSRLYLHNVGTNQELFVETFGREVLPAFR